MCRGLWGQVPGVTRNCNEVTRSGRSSRLGSVEARLHGRFTYMLYRQALTSMRAAGYSLRVNRNR